MTHHWSLTTRIMVISVILILTGLFLYLIRPLLGPMIIAALIAYLLHPLVVRLEAYPRITHNAATNLVYLPFLAILIATPSTLVPLVVRQVQALTDELLLILSQLEAFFARPVVLLGRTISQEQMATWFNLASESFAPEALNAIAVIEATGTSLIWLIMVLVTTYYLLRDAAGVRNGLLGLAPGYERPYFERLLTEINHSWRAYLRGTLSLMLMMGVFFTIFGLAVGLRGAVALGILTGLLSIIPEIGPTIAGILAALAALFQGSSFLPLSNLWFALLVLAVYVVVMQIKSFWLRPVIMGRFMHMNTGLVFVAVIGAALLSGILAALIVLPVLASVAQIGHYIRCRLLDEEPWPAEGVVGKETAVPAVEEIKTATN